MFYLSLKDYQGYQVWGSDFRDKKVVVRTIQNWKSNVRLRACDFEIRSHYDARILLTGHLPQSKDEIKKVEF